MTLVLVGSTAMPFSRPVEEGDPGAWPTEIGAGPTAVQVEAFSGIEVDGTVRSSNRSRESRPDSGPRRAGERRGDRNGLSHERSR
jgi:hypothetical protein